MLFWTAVGSDGMVRKMAGFSSAFLLCHKKRGHQEQHNSLPSVSNLFVDSSSLGDIHVYPVLRTLLFFFQVKETSSLHLLFGLPERGVRWSLGYQMFGFREPVLGPSSSTRGRVRLSGFGHVGLGGSVALCDPASGLAFAMVTNKVGSSVAVLVCTFTAISPSWLMCRIHVPTNGVLFAVLGGRHVGCFVVRPFGPFERVYVRCSPACSGVLLL